MGMRIIEESEASDFLKKCKHAETQLDQKDQLLDRIYSDFEREIVLLGATAVEDRLQEDVPETIA